MIPSSLLAGSVFLLERQNMQVTKRDGSKEEYNVEKIHKVVEWATDGLTNVSMSEIEMNANLSITNGITTEEIHKILIKSANDQIQIINT